MRYIDISRRAGDSDIGQTLVRLAGLAAAAHRHEALREITSLAPGSGSPDRMEIQPAHGWDRPAVASAPAERPDHTEVAR